MPQLATIGGSVGLTRSISEDVADGKDIDPGKAVANTIGSAIGVMSGGQSGGWAGEALGAAVGETASATLNALVPEGGQSINSAIDQVKAFWPEAIQALDQFMRQSICPADFEAGCD